MTADMTAPAPPIPWPDGKRCAVSFSFDMDADALIHIARPDDANTCVSTMSGMRYGPEVGVPRICDLFESYGLKVSFFVPDWCAEEHPQVIERMIEGGHEIAHHGYMHESPSRNTRDRETYWTVRALDSLEHLTGKRPVGYRAPLYDYSQHTTAILAELGFRYESSLMGDDLPYVLRSRSGDLLELPVDWACDDWNQFCHLADIDFVMPIQTPRHAFDVYRAEFEGQYEIGGFWQIVWHPFLIGRAARMRYVRSFIEELIEKGDVWLTNCIAVADHVEGLIAAGTYSPRIDTMPIKSSAHRIPELAEDVEPLRG